MVVCHCRAVTDRVVRDAIEGGARDLESLARWCGAGADCGGCWPALQGLLASCPLAARASCEGPLDIAG